MIIFLVFGNKHRFSALGNFAKSNIYGDILLISLGGRLKSLVGKILYYLGIGKYIAIDANPFLKNKKNSINIWFNGFWKIFKQFKKYDNNYVNIYNPITNEKQKIFQIYPIIYKKKKFNQKPKIIFMGKIFYKEDKNLIDAHFLSHNREKILKKFNLIDNKNFWRENEIGPSIDLLFKNYRILKTYLREQIILRINKNFNRNFFIYGEDKKKIGLNFHNSVYDIKKVKKIYEGNICIDTGPIPGSISLHPRSIMILESNGLIIQAKQNDSDIVWGNLSEKIVFNDIESLIGGLDIVLSNQQKFNEYLDICYEKFEKSNHQIHKVLKNIFH